MSNIEKDIEHGGQVGENYARPKQTGPDFTHGVALYLENVSVWFDSFRALNDLSLYIQEGELRCIIGPNGAGKTTLMDVITGKTRPTEGSAFFGQNYNLAKMSTEQIAESGIGRKFQKPTVFENFTVMENLLLAAPKDKRVKKSLFRKLSADAQLALDESLQQIRLQEFIHKPAGLLSHGQKQWLEIGMLLMQRPKLILLDEPVAGMTDAETERTAELCLELKKNHTLVVVEHDMSFIDTISEKVTVLAQGAILAEGTLAEVQANEDVIEKYLGR
ncbi:urea ABC transporter ATP-binding protein UrtD [Acinetobacter rathckeae]|uniref:urea ABC transporter ATP-binding protein UrtD n=1 Tax=Acinetobacter rathckeae TaxID=2605272 RepID=UPI0018A32544|nr:urea ABC transporter ATP-binding protein UrtD [Acinetobacter rathckeae]MBF7688154.1 urea ABC transporter ATP-binding protein UrtD [Acinetobacter rathckeae]MBF7695334.1 urea ABC transporter ATP-binding protein UrtD [Acinetobacter rathckeae]